MKRTLALGVAALALSSVVASCVIVPQNRRGRLADPIMSLDEDALETFKDQKFYSTREAAAGGDGLSSGGGCSCQ